MLKDNDLISKIQKREITAVGWGSGELFSACNSLVHNFPISFTINTNLKLTGEYISGVEIKLPSALHELDLAKTVLIIYSIEYRDNILEFCKSFPTLKILDYNSEELTANGTDFFKKLNIVNRFNCIEGLNLDFYPKTHPPLRPNIPPFYGLEDEFRSTYDFWLEFRRDIFKEFTRRIHYQYQTGNSGDIAEFGTASGATASIIASAMAQASHLTGLISTRKLHLFDSFKGLPKINNELDEIGGWKEGMFKERTCEELFHIVNKFLPKNDIVMYEGWFIDTLSSIDKSTKFGMINVDCDTYESTFQVLDYLFKNDHINNGCALYFDDWHCGQSSPFLGEQLAWHEIASKYNLKFTDSGDYSALGRKIIVHDNSYKNLIEKNSLKP
jgi:hypothetical protein